MALRSNFEVLTDGGVLMSSLSVDSSVLIATLNSDYIVTIWGRHCLTINMQRLTAPSATEALITIEALPSVDHLSPFEFPLLSLLFAARTQPWLPLLVRIFCLSIERSNYTSEKSG